MGLQQDRIAVVTGASRGAGKGIAIALGATGATVYVTGRSAREGDAPLPGTVQATADAVTAAGGTGIAVHCDHGDDQQVAELFEQVREEQGGLDIAPHIASESKVYGSELRQRLTWARETKREASRGEAS